MFNLEGKSAVVTGAGSGIGRAIAIALAKQGAHVDVLEINDKASIETVNLIRSEGGQAESMSCNVTDHDQVQSVFEHIGNSNNGLDLSLIHI